MKQLGIYIHIPFCKQKCYYCDFTSFSNCEDKIERYVTALKKEIKYQSKKVNEEIQINTIYIGGGTPSFIDAKYIKEIIETIKENYEIDSNAEITIEVNPGTVNKQKLKSYKRSGINRLSIGLQSSNNELLKEIGRIHSYDEFLNCYNLAKEVGFDNMNVDLMIGLPNQEIKDVEESINKIIKLEPKHISLYSLIVEKNTKIEKMLNKKILTLPEEDLERKMYWKAKKMLEDNKYIHYEISNFAKAGYESKHNLNCWNQEEYLGFGLAAHSYYNNIRYCNINNLKQYLENIENEKYLENVIICEKQTQEEKKKEYMLLGLRKLQGVNIQEFKNKYVDNPIYLYRKQLEKLVDEELLEIDLNEIKLTDKGLDLANIVWQEFV